MLHNFTFSLLIFLFSAALAAGQTPGTAVKLSYIAGDVVSVADKGIVVNGKTGSVEAVITDKTVFKRVSAESQNFATAAAGILTDISVGDKLTVSGILAADGKSLQARSVYFITKADITAKNEKESEDWQKRGIKGRVTAVNPQTNQISLEISALTGTTKVTLTPKENAKFRRYAPDSIRFDEALDSTLAEVKAGDMVRALGDKSIDGLSFSAEQILAGAFQTVAGTIKSIDVAKNEILIKNLQTNKDVTIVIGDASVLKRFPAEQAEMLARMQAMQALGAGGARPIGQGRPGGGRPPGQEGQTPGAGRGGGRAGGGIDDMLERSPEIKTADLKVGDVIALSSTRTSDTERFKAIKLYAGVEPFLRSAQSGNGGRRGQGGVEGGFSIPGLDGIDFP